MAEKLEATGEKMATAIQNNVSQGLALVYALAMLTWSAFNQCNSNYWSYFLTEICGLESTAMGQIRSISATGAWIMLVVTAIVIERVWLRHGAYRSWFAIAPAVAGICLLMTWVNPVGFLGVGGTMVWMSLFYTVGQFAVNFFQIASTSIVAAVSKTEHDAALMSTRKSQGNMLVKVGFAIVSLPCILFFNSMIYGVPFDEGKSAGPLGFFLFALILVIAMIALYGLFYKKIEGMDPTEEICEQRYQAKKRGEKLPPVGEKVNLIEMVSLWIRNVPALVGLVCEVARFVAQTLVQGLAIYVFQYVYGDVVISAIFMTIVNVVGLAATIIADPISQKIGIRATYMTGIIISLASCVLLYFFGAMNMYLFTVLVSCIFFGMNFQNATMVGIQANVVAYGEWKHGKACRAFIPSTFQWTPQIANLVSGFVMGSGLASIGYVKGMDPDPTMAQGFVNILAIYPGAIFAIGLVLYIFLYPLNQTKMDEINRDLAAKHAAEDAAKAAAEAE